MHGPHVLPGTLVPDRALSTRLPGGSLEGTPSISLRKEVRSWTFPVYLRAWRRSTHPTFT